MIFVFFTLNRTNNNNKKKNHSQGCPYAIADKSFHLIVIHYVLNWLKPVPTGCVQYHRVLRNSFLFLLQNRRETGLEFHFFCFFFYIQFQRVCLSPIVLIEALIASGTLIIIMPMKISFVRLLFRRKRKQSCKVSTQQSIQLSFPPTLSHPVKQEKKRETKYNKFRRILCGVVVDVVCS